MAAKHPERRVGVRVPLVVLVVGPIHVGEERPHRLAELLVFVRGVAPIRFVRLPGHTAIDGIRDEKSRPRERGTKTGRPKQPTVLTKELLRVSRAGGSYRPQFVGPDREPLAARVLGTYQGHVGETRGDLEAALTDIERDVDEFKLVRGFAKLLDRETTVETRAPVDPRRAREAAFGAAASVGVVTDDEREQALARAGDDLGVPADAVADALYADLDDRQVVVEVDARWDPSSLIEQYNLSLAQTALFDALEVRVRSSDPKALVSATKRLRLMYEIRRTDDGRDVVVTGPDALFRRSRRYGTRFARLLRTVAKSDDWRLVADIDDRGTERELRLSDGDVTVPGTDPITEETFDSGVEADFAARFRSVDLDWALVREPEPLAAGEYAVIPDFAFDYRPTETGDDQSAGSRPDFRVFFEIMGFWTPEYVERKLSRFRELEDAAFVVAVDASLGVGEEVDALTDGAIEYEGSVRVKDVAATLREYEERLVAEAVDRLPDEIEPASDAVTLAAVAEEYGVSESALDGVSFPAHERVGRTLVRPAVLDALSDQVESGMSREAAEDLLSDHGITDASAALARLGYRVEWEGLGGGRLRGT